MRNNRINERGITLIALVITIIVLLLLAGISISMLAGNNSVLNRAASSKSSNILGTAKDVVNLAVMAAVQDYYQSIYDTTAVNGIYTQTGLDEYITKNVGVGNTENPEYNLAATDINFAKYTAGEKNTTSWSKAGSGASITLTYNPDGSSVSGTLNNGVMTWGAINNVGQKEPKVSSLTATEVTALESNGMAELEEDEITNQNLIDNDNIKAVLTGQIPLPVGYSYKEGTSTTESELPTGGSWGVVVTDGSNNEWVWVPANASDMYETTNVNITVGTETVNVTKKSKSNIISNIARVSPEVTSSTSYREPGYISTYDSQEQYYKTVLNFNSAKEMIQSFVDDYNAMISSVEKYGGFYVGRYEVKGFMSSPFVRNTGNPLTNQNWYNLYKANRQFGTKNGTTDITVSTMIWGCQWDVMLKWIANNGDRCSYTTKSWTNHKGNNIINLDNRGVVEMTQEACGTDYRGNRGGGSGWENQPKFRTSGTSIYTSSDFGSRPTLYIK